MKRARDDIADAVMQMDRRRNHHVLHVHQEEDEEDHGHGHGHQSAAPPCFDDDVAFLSLSCGGGGSSSSSSAEEATAGTCTAPPPPPGDKQGRRRRRRRRGRDGEAFECRTCGRQFATFQALGGHRTSHLRRPMTKHRHCHHHHRPKPMLVHACAMCGMGFSTGQALGGHMRRHRGPTATTEEDSSYVGLAQISVHERPSSASLQLLNLFV